MIKVQILDRCPQCEGKAYLPVAEATNSHGEVVVRHLPCPVCQGSGSTPRFPAGGRSFLVPRETSTTLKCT